MKYRVQIAWQECHVDDVVVEADPSVPAMELRDQLWEAINDLPHTPPEFEIIRWDGVDDPAAGKEN